MYSALPVNHPQQFSTKNTSQKVGLLTAVSNTAYKCGGYTSPPIRELPNIHAEADGHQVKTNSQSVSCG